jgi:short-subunit dehydrogenase
MKNIDAKVVLITGASSGIGKALAYEFAREGANVILAARQYALICEIAQDIQSKYPIKAVAIACDVSNEEYCKSLIEQSLQIFGRIDVLVNNAGISMRALFLEVDLNVLKKLMDVNFWGTVYCTKYALPALLKNKGSIIGIASIAAYKGLPARSGYSASKFAMLGFLDSLRVEYSRMGLHVLTVCPNFVQSNIRMNALDKNAQPQLESPIDEKKVMTAESTAKHVVSSYKKGKKQVILTNQGWLIVWLSRFFPSLLDRIIYKKFKKEPNSPLA